MLAQRSPRAPGRAALAQGGGAARSLLAASAVVVCLCAARTAGADDAVERARELDARARAAYEAGERRAAAEAFRAANELVPHPATKYNEARAWEAAGELTRAAEAFETALAAGLDGSSALDAERSVDARSRFEALRARLGKLRVTGPEGARVSVAHLEQAPVPVAAFVTPGDVSLRVTFAGGAPQTRAAKVAAGETLVIDLVEAAKAPPPPEQPARVPPPQAIHPATIAGGVLLGLGGAAGIVCAVFGVRTNDAVETFNDSGFTDADARSEAITNKTVTNVLLGTALGLGAAGVVSLAVGLTSTSDPDGAEVALDLGPGSAGLRFRF